MLDIRLNQHEVNALDIAFSRICEDGGGEYVSYWELDGTHWVLFNEPDFKSTCMLREKDLTVENVRRAVGEKRNEFATLGQRAAQMIAAGLDVVTEPMDVEPEHIKSMKALREAFQKKLDKMVAEDNRPLGEKVWDIVNPAQWHHYVDMVRIEMRNKTRRLFLRRRDD